MGFDEGRIILDSDNGAYYAGQTVFGRIVFEQTKPKTIHGIYVSVKGFCKVHWTTSHRRREGDRDVHYTVSHDSFEEYFKEKQYLFGDASGEHHLQTGQHEFRFESQIPSHCPSSFEGTYGHVRYRVKAVMITSGMFSSNKEKLAAIRVHAPLDLNQNPICRQPVEFELVNTYCCWCISAGSSEIRVKLPVTGYCPGQVIPMEVSVLNHSSVEISELKFALKKDINFEATSSPGTKNEHETIAHITKGPIAGGTTRNWTVEMEVPALDVYNLNGCRFINIDYHLKVSTETSGCHTDDDESHPIIFGTIPLVGFQDNVQNPLQDQLPQPVQAQNVQSGNFYPPQPIINQPYPQTSPYPAPNVTPYPGNQPFPNVTPYPNSSPGYPNNTPYPSNTPYPTNSPYPPGKLPQPGYPGRSPSPIPPYPGGNAAPYPGGNPPAPYPGNNAAPPYPGNNAAPPYPGNFGFAAAGADTAKAPLLPPGASVPYPTSPYAPPSAPASAPAPEPSTPGSDIKKPPYEAPSETSSPYPAYNPEFVNGDKKEKQ
ncbi:arrestin domain-containing protein 17-like [Anticarsia gemmatalis]|uniref:arrestin domain-containing protein 17-like n=1 Tax=Anticarsia gemmatalis TaxID=129554 RepID=UPI003F768166